MLRKPANHGLTEVYAAEKTENGHEIGCVRGAVANVGYKISDTTVENILKVHGIEPAPERKKTSSWEVFLKSHWDVLASVDFTTVEVWTKAGLTTFYLPFVMELKTRRVTLPVALPIQRKSGCSRPAAS